MRDAIRCPGCGREVDVDRPPGMRYEIIQDRDADGARFVEIQVERTSIHRCLECLDGEWR